MLNYRISQSERSERRVIWCLQQVFCGRGALVAAEVDIGTGPEVKFRPLSTVGDSSCIPTHPPCCCIKLSRALGRLLLSNCKPFFVFKTRILFFILIDFTFILFTGGFFSFSFKFSPSQFQVMLLSSRWVTSRSLGRPEVTCRPWLLLFHVCSYLSWVVRPLLGPSWWPRLPWGSSSSSVHVNTGRKRSGSWLGRTKRERRNDLICWVDMVYFRFFLWESVSGRS